MERKVFKTGHSYAITLSRKIMDELGLNVGDEVSLNFDHEGKKLVVKRANRKDQLELGLNIRPKLGSQKPKTA